MRSSKENPVAALRAALRAQTDRGAAALDDAAAALLEAFEDTLLGTCRRLTTAASWSGIDADDLAQEAWLKTLRYLAGERGDRVEDAEHFGRLLMKAAKTQFLDMLAQRSGKMPVELDAPIGGSSGGGEDSASTTRRADLLADKGASAAELLLPKDSQYLLLVEELFVNEAQFRLIYRRKDSRHPRNYKALVLYQIGMHWREEVGVGAVAQDPQMADYIRNWVALLGVPSDAWEEIEQAAKAPGPPADENSTGVCPVLLEAVNRVCGTHLKDRRILAVLRHEMNQFAAQRRREPRGE